MSDPTFWSRPDAREEMSSLERARERWALSRMAADLLFYQESLKDPDLHSDAHAELARLCGRIERALITVPKAECPAIVSVCAGAGGEDARDFCAMTLRELVLYGQRRGLTVSVQDETYEGSGLRDATIRFAGEDAFRIMSTEAGKRRLVRQSPFGSGGRQTSFCAVSVVPEIPIADILIDPKDLRIETYRDTGPGGQHRNTTDSAVRITHLPTGITAKSAMRSQHENKRIAMITLVSRLSDARDADARRSAEDLRAGELDAGFGGHVRTMVFDPYTLVRNEITGEVTSDIEGYLKGGAFDVRAPF